ncbi:MAG: sigma-70 family RNA polymerase sigma factor [Acidobacteria bacterium]|nr:sigma-70 family RNA polymerase sigma factor [Acidobacteriota bacterium]
MAFPPTRLSVVARARSDNEETRRVAVEVLVDAYWKPVYKCLRLKWRLSPEASADMTQDFFVDVLERDLVGRYDPARARFRTYLRLCLDGFAANQLKADQRLKRGGGVRLVPIDPTAAERELGQVVEPAVPPDVDELFYREWVRALFERAVDDLLRQSEARGRAGMFEVFARYDLADTPERPSYADIAAALGLTTATVTNHLAAMRREFRNVVLDRLREVTGSDDEWEHEARRLLGGGW